MALTESQRRNHQVSNLAEHIKELEEQKEKLRLYELLLNNPGFTALSKTLEEDVSNKIADYKLIEERIFNEDLDDKMEAMMIKKGKRLRTEAFAVLSILDVVKNSSKHLKDCEEQIEKIKEEKKKLEE